MHDELLRRYFEEESAKGDLSANQWQNVLSQVKIQKQRRGVWRGAVTSLATRRPLLAMAAMTLPPKTVAAAKRVLRVK